MGNSKHHDWAGLTLIVDGLRVGATVPGTTGTELTGAEIVLLDGLTAGTVTASKAVVVDASKNVGDFAALDAVDVDAGSSGVAGTVDVFPATAARGKLAITAANSAGNTTTTIVNASQAGAVTYTIPDAGAAASFVLSTGTSTGISATSTELNVVAGVTAGQFPAESKAVVAGSDGFVPHRIHIIADGANVVLTTADSGGLVVMDKTDGSLTTLPELTASTIGQTFEFQWPVSYASNDQKIITGNAADFIVGTIQMFDTDTLTDPLSVVSFNGTSHIAVLINAVTDGGLLGSWLRFTAISATQWLIQGTLHHSGNVSSPVSAS